MEFIDRVKAILFSPHSEWPVIARESADLRVLFGQYVAILALIPAVSHFIGMSLVGGYTPIGTALLAGLFIYVTSFVVVYAAALIIDVLAPNFGAHKGFANALRLAVYSYTPFWLAGIFLLVPGLSFLTVLGFYGLYTLWIGLPLLMRAPQDQALLYAASVVACALILALAVGVARLALFGGP